MAEFTITALADVLCSSGEVFDHVVGGRPDPENFRRSTPPAMTEADLEHLDASLACDETADYADRVRARHDSEEAVWSHRCSALAKRVLYVVDRRSARQASLSEEKHSRMWS